MELYAKGYVVPNICSPISSQTIKEAVERYPYLRGLQLAETPTSSDQIEVDILIGADYYWNFLTNITRRGTSSGPVAIWTKLGWVLSGPVINQCENDPKCSVNLNITHVLQIEASTVLPEKDPTVENLLNKFWDLESLGIKKEGPSVYDKFTQEVRFNGDRYEAKLPFKEDHPLLPDNYTTCVKRLGSLVKRLQTTPSRLQEYQRVIQDQISQGVVEPVWKEEVKPPGDVHYLPHREVVRMDKSTTKLRVVYDASAKSNGPSLNDCLFIGPPLTPLIFDILARFRMHPIAVTADIEKAFLNISIAPEHRDFLRFLWVDDPSSKAPQVQVLRFTRVVFGLTSSPFILNATLNHHLSHYVSSYPEFVKEVSRSLYVDDFASGSFNVNSALELSEKVKTRFLEGGFNMRKWQSNSQELMKAYQENATFSESKEFVGQPDAATDKDGAENHTLPTVERDSNPRVLGQIWLPSDDKLKTEFTKAFDGIQTEVVTKRIVLSVAAKFYDPLGLISPIVLMFKLLFQELCKSNLKWDDPLESNLNQKWQSMINGLKEADSVSLNRCYCKELYKDDVKSIQLHSFGDASESAYGACVYLRCEHESSVHCNLVASKTRVAPMVKQTIPRLELLSCLVSARLINSVKKAIGDMVKIHSETLWSDSTTALHWIRNTEKEYKPFVQNRVSEIRKLSSLETWRYCPTQQNPADVASRGVLATQLIHDDKWWYGPNYLQTQKESWPHQPFKETDDNSDYFRELKSPSTKSTVAVASTRISQEHNIEQLLNPTKYSSIVTILRITAYILRFVKNLRSRLNGMDVHQGPLTAEEITAAEKIWIKRIQVALQKLERYKKMKESLALFEDEEGIVRCHGRIEAAPLPYDTKFPILLPTDHHLTRLIVLRSHKDVIHNGVRETLTQVRARFWITRGRQVVKKILSSCTVCRKLEGKPYGSPVSPPLPEFRLSCDFAFTRIGVDYAGPLYVKDVYSKTKDMHKAYISLYTCTSSRAIHLDLVPDATSETFVRSFKRFIGRRGIPSLVVSDNGKTFKGPELRSFVATKNIKWRYIVERSPWWGGFYERMVRSVKRCLKKILSNARLNYEELYTVLIQIEAVLNSRPLTYVYQEGDEPLTPSHLVLGRRLLSATPEPEKKGNESGIKREKHLKIVLDHFWRRCKSEYLTELREHHKPNPKEGPKIQIGDTVSIYEDKIKRLNWNMGLVEQLITGKDGKVRATVVRVINKGGKLAQIRRPVQKLYPVELQNDDEKEKNLPGFPITYVEQAQQENI